MTPLATVLLDPPTTLMAGGILAVISMKLISRGGLPEVWRAARFGALFALVYALSVGWFFFQRADWMFVYLADTSRLPLVPLYLAFTFICVGFGVMGTLGVATLLHLGQRALAWATLAAAVASLACVQVLTLDRYVVVGTTAQFAAGAAPKLTDDGTMLVWMNLSPLLFGTVAIAIIVVQVRRILKGAQPS